MSADQCEFGELAHLVAPTSSIDITFIASSWSLVCIFIDMKQGNKAMQPKAISVPLANGTSIVVVAFYYPDRHAQEMLRVELHD